MAIETKTESDAPVIEDFTEEIIIHSSLDIDILKNRIPKSKVLICASILQYLRRKKKIGKTIKRTEAEKFFNKIDARVTQCFRLLNKIKVISLSEENIEFIGWGEEVEKSFDEHPELFPEICGMDYSNHAYEQYVEELCRQAQEQYGA